MGLIQAKIMQFIRRRKEERQSQPSKDIENFRQEQHSSMRVEAMRDLERREFFSKGNEVENG